MAGCLSFRLLQVFIEHRSKLIFRDVTDQLLDQIPLSVQKVKLRLIVKTECMLENIGAWIIRIQIRKLDLAKIFRFKPMNHGRHCAAGTSGKAKEFDELQLP
jgi:hypothetical protein